MTSPEEQKATADRLTDALAAAAAIMRPHEAYAFSGSVPGRLASPASRPVRRPMGRLRAWLVPVGIAASVSAIILTAVAIAGHPGTGKGTVTAPAPASAGPGITSLAGVPSVPGTQTRPPAFYVSIVGMGLSPGGIQLMTVQVRRTSDGRLTGTVRGLPAGWILVRNISVTADDRTFTVAAQTQTVCPSSTPTKTRFYQFSVTSSGHVTGLRAVGHLITGEPVSEFAASPDGTEVAYAEQGCVESNSAMANTGAIHIMNLTSGAVRSWHNTVSAATPARVSDQIGQLSWTADGRTLVADYLWVPPEGSLDLAVLGLDATSSGGSLQAHSHVLFSQNARCTVCVYTAVISSDGSALTVAAASAAPPSRRNPGTPRFYLSVLQLSSAIGQPTGILYRSGASDGPYNNGGLVPVLSADGPGQHLILWQDPEGFSWLSGGKQIEFPGAPSGVLAVSW
jgi:hypothetical protein